MAKFVLQKPQQSHPVLRIKARNHIIKNKESIPLVDQPNSGQEHGYAQAVQM